MYPPLRHHTIITYYLYFLNLMATFLFLLVLMTIMYQVIATAQLNLLLVMTPYLLVAKFPLWLDLGLKRFKMFAPYPV